MVNRAGARPPETPKESDIPVGTLNRWKYGNGSKNEPSNKKAVRTTDQFWKSVNKRLTKLAIDVCSHEENWLPSNDKMAKETISIYVYFSKLLVKAIEDEDIFETWELNHREETNEYPN